MQSCIYTRKLLHRCHTGEKKNWRGNVILRKGMYLFFGSEAIFRSVCRSRGLSTAINLSAVFTFHRFCALLVNLWTPSTTLLKCFTANTFSRLPFYAFLVSKRRIYQYRRRKAENHYRCHAFLAKIMPSWWQDDQLTY